MSTVDNFKQNAKVGTIVRVNLKFSPESYEGAFIITVQPEDDSADTLIAVWAMPNFELNGLIDHIRERLLEAGIIGTDDLVGMPVGYIVSETNPDMIHQIGLPEYA